MKLLITGSDGYCGNFLSEYFSSKGFEVIGLDLSSMPRQTKYANFKFIHCDVRDRERLFTIFKKEKPTHVLHLAYLMDPQHSRRFEYDVDVVGSKNVFDAANSVRSVDQLVHFSSASVYGGFPDNELWIPETQRPRPRDWVYAQNKVIVENYYFATERRFKLVNYRMCTAVGHSYYKKGGVVVALCAPVGILLNGRDTKIQFIHEDDVKSLTELVVGDDEIEGTFNLASPSFATTKAMNPRRFKMFIPFPKPWLKAIFRFLWNTRLASVSPTCMNLMAHDIVVSPRKLQDRYGYTFRHSTKDAFFYAVERRKAEGNL